jgi:hypothetical protein
MAAISVYLFVRPYPPAIQAPFQSTDPGLAKNILTFGSAPSFFYTLAFGQFIRVCVSSSNSARVHCLAWIGLALCMESSQYPIISESISTWLYSFLSEPIWEFVGPYWPRGVLDPLDLLATLTGGTIALYLLTHLPLDKGNAQD